MTLAVIYASKKLMQLTRVTFREDADAYLYFERLKTWQDVVRVKLVDGDTLVHDHTDRARLKDPDWDKQEAIAQLAARMDKPRTICERAFAKDSACTPAEAKLDVRPGSSDLCWCGHIRIEHDGPQSTGHCHAVGCVTRCGHFRMKR